MKNVFRTALFAAILVTVSCGKETADTIADTFDEEVEQLENTVLDVDTISNNVIIEGGAKMEGAPPTPNGAISLDISDSGKSAFLGEGFDVSLGSDANLIGAYIQFKSKDGTVSDSYYDVNLEANSTDLYDKSARRRREAKLNSFSTSKTDETVLDVDFNANIEPGEFCYVLCVYDNAGNISDPQEICLTVESWGGNNALVGAWKLTKEVDTAAGVTVTTAIGEEVCESYSTTQCADGGTYQLGSCTTRDSMDLTINNDGTYEYDHRFSGRHVDPSLSDENCEAIYKEDTEFATSAGKWAFIAEEDRLVLLEFAYEEGFDDQVYTGTYEIGQAYDFYNGQIQLESNTFIMTDESSEYDEVSSYYFEKE